MWLRAASAGDPADRPTNGTENTRPKYAFVSSLILGLADFLVLWLGISRPDDIKKRVVKRCLLQLVIAIKSGWPSFREVGLFYKVSATKVDEHTTIVFIMRYGGFTP